MIIPRKAAATILNEMITELQLRSDITNLSAGSLARTLLEVINAQLEAAYDALNINLMQSFVSTASGIYLDYIGRLLGATRYANELDTDFRYRITQQYLLMAKANETAIRLACLSVVGVQDIIIENFFYGTGSFAVRVITDELSPDAGLLTTVQRIVDETRAAGIYAKAILPDLVDLNISYSVVFSNNMITTATSLAGLLKEEIQAYLDSIGVGGTIDITRLIRMPYTLSSATTESRILDLSLNDETIYQRTFLTIPSTSRLRAGNIRVNGL